MRRFLVAFLLSSTLAFGQNFPPDSDKGVTYDGGSVTNPVLAPDGAIATPAFSFTSQTAAGMWTTAGNQIQIQAENPTSGGCRLLIEDDEAAATGSFLECQLADTSYGRVTTNWATGSPRVTLTVFEFPAFTNTVELDSAFTSFSDPIRGATASESSPMFSFTGDTDVGTYVATTNVLGLAGPAGVQLPTIAFASLPAASNGVIIYCSDCTKATPCAGSSNGALAKRLNGAWDCD